MIQLLPFFSVVNLSLSNFSFLLLFIDPISTLYISLNILNSSNLTLNDALLYSCLGFLHINHMFELLFKSFILFFLVLSQHLMLVLPLLYFSLQFLRLFFVLSVFSKHLQLPLLVLVALGYDFTLFVIFFVLTF